MTRTEVPVIDLKKEVNTGEFWSHDYERANERAKVRAKSSITRNNKLKPKMPEWMPDRPLVLSKTINNANETENKTNQLTLSNFNISYNINVI